MRRDEKARVGSRVLPALPMVLVGLIALGFGVRATADLWPDVGGLFIGPNTPDANHYLWWLGHTPHAIGSLENPFRTFDMNIPDGVSAMNNTTLLLPAIILFPITLLASSLVTLNVLNILAIPLCALAGYWSLRNLPWDGPGARSIPRTVQAGPAAATDVPADDQVTTRDAIVDGEDSPPSGPEPLGQQPGRISRPAALIGAVAFALCPAIVNSLVGHITMSFAPLLPVLIVLSVLAWYGPGHRPVRTGALLGLAATAQVFTGEEVLFQAVVVAVLVLLVAGLSRPRAVPGGLGRLARTLAVSFAIFLPITAYPLYLQFFGPMKQHGSPFLLDYYGADLTAFTTPTDRLLLHTDSQAAASAKFPGGIEEHLAYLGWPLLFICLVTAIAYWPRLAVRCTAVVMAFAAVMSVGGRIWINGVQTEHKGPYAILQSLPVTEASLASRFGLMVGLAAAALLAFTVHGVSRWRPRVASGGWPGGLLATAIALVCLAPLLPAKHVVAEAGDVPSYFSHQAKALPAGSTVLVLPWPEAAHAQGMRWQAVARYHFVMPGGYFLGPGPDGHAYIGGSQDPPTALLLQNVANTGQVPIITDVERAQAVVDLRAWGVDQVVLGPDWSTPQLRQTMTALLGRAPESIGGVDVWTSPVS